MSSTRLLVLILTASNVIDGFRMPFFLVPSESEYNGTDACNGFYERTCHDWHLHNSGSHKTEPFWNQYLAVSYEINAKLQNLLEQTDDGFYNSNMFYIACLDATNSLDAFKVLIEKLSWDRNEPYNFLEHTIEVAKVLNVHSILKFHVGPDFTNGSLYMLYIDSGDLVFPETYLQEPTIHERELKIYHEWIVQTLKQFFDGELESRAWDLIGFEIAVAKAVKISDKLAKLTVDKLPSDYNWLQSIQFLLKGTNIQMNLAKMHFGVRIGYVKRILNMVERTSPEIIADYVTWSAIKALSRDSTVLLRKLNFAVDKAILGIQKDVTREHECTRAAIEYFSNELSDRYRKTHLNSVAIVADVEKIAENIRLQSIRTIQEGWTSRGLKNWLVNRIKTVRFEIGDPKWQQGPLEMRMSANHFHNVVKLRELQSLSDLKLLESPVDSIRWPSNVFDVNAYYSPLQNAIILPLGLLHEPFYNTSRPPSENYGALGSLIGHEMAHALEGAYGKYWTRRDVKMYSLKSRCFRKQYERYGVDGALTMSENLADNVGIRISYEAWLKNREMQADLFFTSYAKMWCETNAQSDTTLQEEHSPVNLRVLGALENFPQFNKYYKCKRRRNVCSLW